MAKERHEFLAFFGTGVGMFVSLIGIMYLASGLSVITGLLILFSGIAFIIFVPSLPDIWDNVRKRIKFIPLHFTPVSLLFWILPLFFVIPMVIFEIEDFFDIRILRTWSDITSVNGHAYSNANAGDVIGSIFILFFIVLIYAILFFVGYFIMQTKKEKCEVYYKYIEENKVSLGLFTRPYSSNSDIVLANKYVIIDFNLISFINSTHGKIEIYDKIKNIRYQIEIMGNFYKTFEKLCKRFNYDTMAQDLINLIPSHKDIKKQTKNQKNFLDINQASEAELTALPGVTIAKAKRAIKMRKKYAFYLSANQFYEAINLEEQFIEQITSNGTKILLNNLPEYKALEMKQEE